MKRISLFVRDSRDLREKRDGSDMSSWQVALPRTSCLSRSQFMNSDYKNYILSILLVEA